MTIRKEEEERLEEDEGISEIEEDESFEEEMEKQDAQSRQIYDPKTRTFNDAKRRATDLKECSRITLPKPLETRHEAMIETRRNMNEKTYNQYRDEECNKKGEVRGNMTEEEKDGLKSLQKRIKNKEIVILKTDKSGKLCVATREEYERMGHEHTKKDVEIGRKQIIEMEKQLNGHVFFWAKIWGSGEAHGHKDRIIDSKVVSSEQLADLYLTYKDHKEGRKTRPVVTGCNSNSMGFSNSVSDLLESVNKANQDPYECISSEDMLANIEKFNTEARKIKEEGRQHLLRKISWEKEERNMKAISRCDKLWKKKSEEARMASSNEEDEGANDMGARARIEENLEDLRQEEDEYSCKEEKNEETLKFRMHQYKENPSMKITGEEVELVMNCDHCGPCITDLARQDCGECGQGWVREDYTLCILGNDVVSLFPSLESASTGKIVREEVARSTMNVDGFNVKLRLK